MNRDRTFVTRLGHLAIALVAAAGLFAPSFIAAKDKKPAPVDPSKLVWPSLEEPRLKFVAQFHGDDVKGVKKQGMLERLAGVRDVDSKDVMIKPWGVAVDSKSKIYVSDTVLHQVFVLDVENRTIAYRGDNGAVHLTLPTGVAIDEQDRLFVSDAATHNIAVFSPAGDPIDVFGEDTLERPSGMAVDNTLERLYVADIKTRKVAQFNLKTFKFERWIGISPQEKFEAADKEKLLYSPTNVAVDADGLLYVVDTFTNRIVVFDAEGEYARQFGETGAGPGKFMRPRGIAIDADGHIWVSDGFLNTLQAFTPDGKALMPACGEGSDPGKLEAPSGMAFDQNNRLVVADQNNRRIQTFRYLTDEENEAAKKVRLASAKKK